MNTRFLLIILLFLLGHAGLMAQQRTLEEVFLQLDTAVARRAETRARLLDGISRTKRDLMGARVSPFTIAERLEEVYEDVSTDSALKYSLLKIESAGDDPRQRQRGQLDLAVCMIRRGEYAWAEQKLNALGRVYEENSLRYYMAWDMLRSWENEQLSPGNEMRNSSLWSYADSMYRYKNKGVDQTIAHAQNNIYVHPREAADTLLALAAREGENLTWRYIGKRLGLCYQELGQRDSAEYYLALSALADMTLGVVQHTSLHLLSLMLLEDGDIQRAYYYTRATLEDAMLSGTKLRMEQVARTMPTVLDAYHEELETRQQRISMFTAILAALLIVVSVMLYYTYRARKRLSASHRREHALNEQLKHKEVQLSELLEKQAGLIEELSRSNKTKEIFVAQYMRQCVTGIQQLEHYRLSLQKVAMQGNMDKLVTAIKKKEFIEKELESFYRGFDETFLQIFPHFVEDFNALLREEHRIVVPEGRLLTVDLRIHALIRLGITESEDIAKFLHYSAQTIYNYRSRVRGQSLYDREEFDRRLREIE